VTESHAEAIQANGHVMDPRAFRSALIAWGRSHFRSFPWRLTDNPYHILMAEVMLHRTQAPQVVPVYLRFQAQYPTISASARATKQELHALLYPLGLRWRIDLIYEMTSDLVSRFGGRVPQGKDDLLSLPGVSQYIAGAVRCFAWNLPEPLIDTNSVRVVGRLFGLEVKDSSRRNRRFGDLVAELVDREVPRSYNYSLLDLADQVCKKKRSPECGQCPVLTHCTYGLRAAPHPTGGRKEQQTDG
jgi:A/G-specific adenine glycosylase